MDSGSWGESQGLECKRTLGCLHRHARYRVSVGHRRANIAVAHRKRLHSALGYNSPVQFLKDWIKTQQDEKQMASDRSLIRRETEGGLLRDNMCFANVILRRYQCPRLYCQGFVSCDRVWPGTIQILVLVRHQRR